MTREERVISRILFKNNILEANGQKFEDLFSAITNFKEPDFKQIKPWGNIGDRKNDGCILNRGIYFQVHAPENVNELFNDTDYQYIATVNQNQLNEVKSILTKEEYEEIIEQNTVLTLTDEDDSEKLLGVKVDVEYE